MKKLSFRHLFTAGMIICVFASCSTTRYVPEGEYLLNKVELVLAPEYKKDVSVSQLRGYLRQNPNSRLFSLFKTSLATYSLSGRDSTRWINRILKDMGEPPVIFDSLLAQRSCSELTQELRNEGYMQANVTYEVDRYGKKANVTYHLHPGKPYYIHAIRYLIEDECIDSLLKARNDKEQRLLKEGMQFDLTVLDDERKRLTTLLNNEGYYRFHKEYITYLNDTVPGSSEIDITLRLSKYHRQNNTDTLHTKYYINDINYLYAEGNNPNLRLRKSVLEECTHLSEGASYSASKLQQTYTHFGRLPAVKYTNIALRQLPDSNMLNCDIMLQTNKPSTISFQPEGTNTSGDLGMATSLTYQNRNLFRGGEVLSLELRGAFEAIKGLEGYSNQNFTEYSVETRLAFPRFLIPFISRDLKRESNATSELSVLYDMQNRPEFHRRVLSASWRYKWHFPNRNERYQVDLLNLNYVFMPWISDTFRREYLESTNTRNAILRYNYENLFITKIGFNYSFNKRNIAVKFNVETSGNLLYLCSDMLRFKKDSQGRYTLFNIAFAQYARGDFDITHSLDIDRNNQLVFHLGAGIAYPYGNSTILPFEKRYFSGGPNSVRGWSVRSLGPGKYKERDGRINFINQTGDMKLDINLEYRTHLFWKIGGALFVDAGNIWTLRDYSEQPGGVFNLSEFYTQLAVSYGLGLRFNFNYFILRFDAGMKAVNPAYEADNDEHYPLLHPKLSRDFAFHFAVGLPF